MKLCFLADNGPAAMQALRACIKKYGQVDLAKADVVIVLGGDGFMLKTLHGLLNYQTPVFGLNLGHVGYLLNHFSLDDLPDRVENTDRIQVAPLHLRMKTHLGQTHDLYAFNEFAFGRSRPQAARLNVVVTDECDLQPRLVEKEFLGDGLIVATRMGCHGYFASAGGTPLEQDGIGVQSVCSKDGLSDNFSTNAHVYVVPQESVKRPVHVDCDGQTRIENVQMATVQSESKYIQTLLKERSKS